MYHTTHIETLGTEYSISDQEGNIIGSVQIIPHTEILDAAMGNYTTDFLSFDQYLQKSIEVLEGWEEIDPNSVLWYATENEEVVLSELIQYAINNGYDKIIIEHLDPVE